MQKRQAVMRDLSWLDRWLSMDSFWLEDVAIDIRAMVDGYKSYSWQYQEWMRISEKQ